MEDLKDHIKNLPKKNYQLNFSTEYKIYKEDIRKIVDKITIEQNYTTHILISNTKKNYQKKYYSIKKFTSNLYLIIFTEDIFITGLYKKFSRKISQTKFSYENIFSVEEFLFSYLRKFGSGYFIFSAVGREDIDVLQLGGRRFFIRIKNPDFPSYEFLSENVDLGDVQFLNMEISTRQSMHYYMETKFSKEYRIILLAEREFSVEKIEINREYIVEQKTPLRVLHRRPNLLRRRTVLIKSVKKIENLKYEVVVETEAGLYVKEFIHGDFQRSDTLNTLFELGSEMELEYLDVIKILYN